MLLMFSGSNNRMDGYSYDAAGNLLNDGTHSYTYDAENRIYKVDGGSTATYYYDADGHSVQKNISASNNQNETPGTWYFLYGLNGRLVAELTSGVSFWRGEIYAGDRHLASIWEGDTYFDHQDQVGTERARFSYYYKSNSTSTSLPFGDWLTWPSANQSPVNFTGQRRDPESGLDDFGARYYGSLLGRFLSIDPVNAGAESDAPQSWNAYSYAANNPINAIDPSGMDCIYVQGDGSWDIKRGDCTSENDNGIFVDGRIIGKTVVVTQDGEGNANSVSFLYNPTGTNELLFHGESDPAISPAPSFLAGIGQAIGSTFRGMDPFHDPTSRNESQSQTISFIFGSVLGPEEEEAGLPGLTRWGWKGTAKWNRVIEMLAKPGTHVALEGIVPTAEEATEMIKQAGGTIDRIEEHAPGGVSPHSYPHINYTTVDGQKATLRIDRLP